MNGRRKKRQTVLFEETERNSASSTAGPGDRSVASGPSTVRESIERERRARKTDESTAVEIKTAAAEERPARRNDRCRTRRSRGRGGVTRTLLYVHCMRADNGENKEQNKQFNRARLFDDDTAERARVRTHTTNTVRHVHTCARHDSRVTIFMAMVTAVAVTPRARFRRRASVSRPITTDANGGAGNRVHYTVTGEHDRLGTSNLRIGFLSFVCKTLESPSSLSSPPSAQTGVSHSHSFPPSAHSPIPNHIFIYYLFFLWYRNDGGHC